MLFSSSIDWAGTSTRFTFISKMVGTSIIFSWDSCPKEILWKWSNFNATKNSLVVDKRQYCLVVTIMAANEIVDIVHVLGEGVCYIILKVRQEFQNEIQHIVNDILVNCECRNVSCLCYCICVSDCQVYDYAIEIISE